MKAGDSSKESNRGKEGFKALFFWVGKQLNPRQSSFSHFILTVLHRFYNDHCLDIAGSLTFTTLLALVPLVTVIFGILRLFPAFHELTTSLHELLSHQLIPTSGELIQRYVLEFSRNAGKLTLVGSIGLFLTSILTLWEIDLALNAIWHTHKRRQKMSVFLVYWALLTVGPLFFGVGIAATTAFYSIYQTFILGSGLPVIVGWGLVRVVSTLFEATAFLLIFRLVPRVPVKFRHALAGGIFSAVLFEIAKHILAFYLTHFKTYELIYGAFSAIPALLIWIFIVWAIILLGAEVTACLGGDCHKLALDDLAANRSLWLAARILIRLGAAQRSGRTLTLYQLNVMEPQFSYSQVETMLQRLSDLQVARPGIGDEWVLIRDLHEMTLADLYNFGGFDLDPVGVPGTDSQTWDEWLGQHIHLAHGEARQYLDKPLAEMLTVSADHQV